MQEIKSHYNENDIQVLQMNSDLSHWREIAENAQSEINFLSNLLHQSTAKQPVNEADAQFLKNELKSAKEFNEALIDQIFQLETKLEGMKECEDLECETYFLNEHLQHKRKIREHFSKYRNLKKTLFSYFNPGIE
ncbi:MAG: hypothetical protein LAT51_08215 [Flavobacteriaceae bacterium]|nr:hypothetical protein [Flavobacteriaceae bacterium]